MAPRILIAGGYGVIGSAVARQIRRSGGQVDLVLAGRNPERGAALVEELGGAGTARVDLDDAASLGALASVDLIVAALHDPANVLIEAALARGIAHIGLTSKAEDIAPVAFAVLRSPPMRPLVLLGYCAAGTAAVVAQHAAERFSRIESVAVAALYDPLDPVGPMTDEAAPSLVSRALLRQGGKWTWVDGRQHARPVRLSDGEVLCGYPTALLDVPSLASTTGAADVRFDFVTGESLGTRGGGRASSDVYIDIEGVLATGGPGRSRTLLSDPNGLAHLCSLGVLAAVERVLGLDGQAPAEAGLHLPFTLLSPAAAVARLARSGVRICGSEPPQTVAFQGPSTE